MSEPLAHLIAEYLPRIFRDQVGAELRPLDPEGGDDSGCDLRYEFELDGELRPLCVQVKTSDPRRDVRQWRAWAKRMKEGVPAALPLVAAPALAEPLRRELRELGINHADLQGNVYIWEPHLRVHVQGDPTRRVRLPVRRSGRAINPFSKRASFLLRALLHGADRRWGVRELSAETGLSVGYTSDVAAELVRRGYAREAEGRLSLGDPVRALYDWANAYRWEQNATYAYVTPYETDELRSFLVDRFDGAGIEFAFTLLAGADLVARHVVHGTTHVYVAPGHLGRALEIVGERLYGEPAEGGGSLQIAEPYYARSGFYGSRRIDGFPVVSSVQLFLDLVRYPLRGPEAAGMLVRTSLRHEVGMKGAQVKALTALIGAE